MTDRLILQAQECKIAITTNPSQVSTLNPANYSSDELSKAISITFTTGSNSKTISIRCSYLSEVENCAVIEHNVLILLLNEQIFRISIPDASITAYTQLDPYGCYFGIYKTPCGYVVHGEIDIIGLNEDLTKAWVFSAYDVFVSVTGNNTFVLTDSSIQLFDFQNNFYEIDYQGKVIKEVTPRTIR